MKHVAGSKGRVQYAEVLTVNTAQDWTIALKAHLLYTLNTLYYCSYSQTLYLTEVD